MKDLYIIGNSGFAKEVYELSLHLEGYEFKGFIDYKPEKDSTDIFGKNFSVFDEDEFLKSADPEKVFLAIGIGDPKTIKNVAQKFEKFNFPNLIHPRAAFNENFNSLGRGNILTANVIFTANTTVGDFNIFNLSTTVGHDCIIQNCNVFNPAVNISGGVEIGNENLIGVASTILQYKKIGNQCIVAGGSMVTKNVEDGTLVLGIPAKPVQ